MDQRSWSDFYRDARDAGMDDASACHAADEAMDKQKPANPVAREQLRRFGGSRLD